MTARTHAAALALLVLVALGACGATKPAAPPASTATFQGQRGINLHNWFAWTKQISPYEYRFPVFQNQPGELRDDELRGIRSAGFDFVRLPVDPGVFMAAKGADLAQAQSALEGGIRRILSANLSVVVEMFPVSGFRPEPQSSASGAKAFERGPSDPTALRYQAAVAALAGALERHFSPEQVAFELMNEPDLPCGAPSWRTQQSVLHRKVRAAAPRLTLVLTGSCWSGIDGLTALRADDYRDPNVLYTFHFYEDHRFTHQGTASGDPLQATTGLPYPWNARSRAEIEADSQASLAMQPDGGAAWRAGVAHNIDMYLAAKWDRAAVDRRMDQVGTWAKANAVPPANILMGEFGVNRRGGLAFGAREEDRLRWLRDVRESAQAQGFRWSVWVYRSSNRGDLMDLEVERGDGRLQPAALQALGLPPRP